MDRLPPGDARRPVTHVVLSHIQVEPILRARRAGQPTATSSLDLGITPAQLTLDTEHVRLPDGQSLAWDTLEEIDANKTACFLIENNSARKIQFFSEQSNRHYGLLPTARAPALLIAGLPMHRIKGIDPCEDTARKIRCLSPVLGRVLDTATGLGYTAIEAARTANQVVTIEIDPTGLQIARLNPWSQALFDNPKIQQHIGDSFEEVRRFEDGFFSCVLHDPPTFSLAGDLYSEDFYRQLFRVLRRDGRLFHYIGDLASQSGQRVLKGVLRRLHNAGFTRTTHRPEAFGVLAHK